MKIALNTNRVVTFAHSKNEANSDKNPISKTGERATRLKATVIAGLALGGRALLWLYDEGFIGEGLWYKSENIAKKNFKNETGSKQTLRTLGVWGAMIIGFIAVVSALYTLVKTPEIMYDGKVNAFKKGKDMDVYIKGNEVEKELYNQMNDKAKEATPEEKEILKQQYLKLKAAKNQTPDFIQNKKQ